jgi:hypothetical protein
MFLYDLSSLLGKCKPDLRGERLSTNQHGSLGTLCRAIQSVHFIASLNTSAVTVSAGRCGLSMRQIWRPPGNDKGNIVCCLYTKLLGGMQPQYLLVSVTYGTLAPPSSFVCTQNSSFIRIGKQTTCIRRGGICG